MKALHSQRHLSASQIAHRLSLCPQTVKKWLSKERFEPRRYAPRPSILDSYKGAIVREMALGQSSVASIYRLIKSNGYHGGYTTTKDFVRRLAPPTSSCRYLFLPYQWMLQMLQGQVSSASMLQGIEDSAAREHVEPLLERVLKSPLKERNRALSVLARIKGIAVSTIAQFLMLNDKTVQRYLSLYRGGGLKSLFGFRLGRTRKAENSQYRELVFAILHSPPTGYGVNRTTWTMESLHRVMKQQESSLSKDGIREIIRSAGFRFRKAKKVLTSNDPDYRIKLQQITNILRNLKPNDKFFSVDEYGPFAVKIQGGRSLMRPGEMRTVPQRQKSKGSLILTAARSMTINLFFADNYNFPVVLVKMFIS